MPLFARFAAEHAETGFALREGDDDKDNHFRNRNRVCFDLFLRYGVIPSAGDRHVVEFLPPWYLENPETVKQWGFDLTPVSWRKKNRERLLAKRSCIISGEEAFTLQKSGEEGTTLFKALLGMGDTFTNMNTPNNGQMDGIDRGVIVETNAWVGRDAVRPAYVGQLPEAVHNLVRQQAVQQETLVSACLKKDSKLAFHVFISDPLVRISRPEAEKLFHEMLMNTKKYLEGWEI
jgi:alpha-galactosidase